MGTGIWWLESRGLAQIDAVWMAVTLACSRTGLFVFVYPWTHWLGQGGNG